MWHNHVELIHDAKLAELLDAARRERMLREAGVQGHILRGARLWLGDFAARLQNRLPTPVRASGTRRAPETVILRLVALHGELYRLPQGEGLRVRSGRAWVTYDGNDVVMGRGETTRLTPGGDFALVSALGQIPLVWEVLCDLSHSHPQSLIGAPLMAAN